MALEPLISAEELRNALGLSTYMALFDDLYEGNPSGDVTKVDASASVTLIRQRAHVRCVSRLPAIYGSSIPDGTDTNVSMLLKDAELSFAVGLSFDRHPEYVDRYGWDPVRKGAYQTAMETMDLIQDAVLRIVPRDAPPEPTPRNVGGVVVDGGSKMFLTANDGTNNSGDW
jgi:hypothetical protein